MRRRPILSLGVACALGACAIAPQGRDRFADEPPTKVQALIGVSVFQDLDTQRADPGDPSRIAETDVSQMPMFGLYGQEQLGGEGVEVGFEGGVIVSWWRDQATIRDAGSGSIVAELDQELIVTDLSAGLYASTLLGSRVRVYFGAGPLMMFATQRTETELSTTRDSEFGLGGYARTGFEWVLDDGSMLGLGARAFRTNLEFDTAYPGVDLEGIQAMLTFTQWF
ncbi:MAG: hypothetical protein KDB80_08430 [Planctomycetes bacterium]|nr:hypothetical protein [Planctomycetota bacterium]